MSRPASDGDEGKDAPAPMVAFRASGPRDRRRRHVQAGGARRHGARVDGASGGRRGGRPAHARSAAASAGPPAGARPGGVRPGGRPFAARGSLASGARVDLAPPIPAPRPRADRPKPRDPPPPPADADAARDPGPGRPARPLASQPRSAGPRPRLLQARAAGGSMEGLRGGGCPGSAARQQRVPPRFAGWCAKLVPISLAVSPLRAAEIAAGDDPAAREDGRRVLRRPGRDVVHACARPGWPSSAALAREGIRVDLATERLDRREFYRRSARAWISLVPGRPRMGLLPPLRGRRSAGACRS